MMAHRLNQFEMKLSELLSDICVVSGQDDCVIKGITADSRQVVPGDLFIACQGDTVNGVDFIDVAIERGAVAIVWESESGVHTIASTSRQSTSLPLTTAQRIPVLAANDLGNKTGLIAHRFFGAPSHQTTVTAVTGTNGKTSITQYLAQVLKVDAPCGTIGTLGYGIYPKLETSTHTTPDVITMHRWLAELFDAGASNVAIEVSSHALMQGRINNVKLHCGVFTNLTRDHLDYHGDMQSYANAKARLFKQFNLSHAVINIDDPAGLEMISHIPVDAETSLWRYGFTAAQQAEVKANNLQLNRDGLSFEVTTPLGKGHVNSKLLGAFNASNLLAVLAVLLIHGVPLKGALARLSMVKAVPGRMEKIDSQQNKPVVVIDYAHTPDALQQALTSLKQHTEGRLCCVFGCGGNRDKGKRAPMGKIAETCADFVVLTNDNPRNEKPMDIIKDIQQGITEQAAVHVETDRHQAIAYALEQCGAEDVVLVAGKGHESWQIIGENKIPFSDSETVKTLLGIKQP